MSQDGEEGPRPGYGLPHPGSWTPTRTYEGERFTIAYPASAKAEKREEDDRPALTISELPGCKWPCYVSVSVWRDSMNLGLRELIRRRTTPDTTGGNTDADDYLPTVLDSIPVGDVPARRLELYCGDCTSSGILTVSGGWIAEIEYVLDDRDGNDEALLKQLETVARSLRWRQH